MRLPEEANRWKSDGRTIELDLNDPSVAQSDTPGKKPMGSGSPSGSARTVGQYRHSTATRCRPGAGLRSRKSLWQTWSYCSWMSLSTQIACIR